MSMPGYSQGAYGGYGHPGSPGGGHGYGPGGGQGQGGYGYGPPEYQQQPLMQQGGPGGGYGQAPYPQGGNYGPPGNYSASAPSNTLSTMNLVFFAAACCIMLGAFVGSIFVFFSIEWVNCLGMSYLLIFGAIMAILDTPFFKNFQAMHDLKKYIGKYINLLTRVTGKGITFLFLGSALFSNMWDNLEGGFLQFLAVVLCLFPAFVGLAAIVIGIMKSQKLSKARKHVEMSNIEQRYDSWAVTYKGQHGGLTKGEFNTLTMENGVKWEDADLTLIFNALVSNPSWRVSSSTGEAKMPKEDLVSWVRGGMVWL